MRTRDVLMPGKTRLFGLESAAQMFDLGSECQVGEDECSET